MSNDGPQIAAASRPAAGQPPPGDANTRTISTYDQYAQRYIERTTHAVTGVVKEWLDRTVDGLPRDARILELGSAFGRDADYLRELGYRVRCTDATPAFVTVLRSRGIDATPLNAITDDLPADLDALLANAVLLHFTRAEFAAVVAKARRALRPGGRFAFTVRLGDGQEWSNRKMDAPRFFCYWREPQLRDVLSAAGFADIDIREVSYHDGGMAWLHAVAAT